MAATSRRNRNFLKTILLYYQEEKLQPSVSSLVKGQALGYTLKWSVVWMAH